MAPSSAQRLVRSKRSKASKDADDAERRGVEDVDGAAGFDDFDGAAGVNGAGEGAGQDLRSFLAFVFSLRRAFNNPLKRHGVEGVGGVAGIDDVDVAAVVSDVGRVLGGGHGSLLRR